MSLSLFACGSNDFAVTGVIVGGSNGPTNIIVSDNSAKDALPEYDESHTGSSYDTLTDNAPPEGLPDEYRIDEEGWYYSAEDVSLYLVTYGELPDNFVTKSEARELGWAGGSVEQYAPGRAIGGDIFQNREGLLPKIEGVTYYECDIDTEGTSSRGGERLVFSDDGWIYYSPDHYESFELLYEDAW
ncbi:MAG: ribonuclease [Ruminococcaceae bacterium]|nr:ribonuclease [Oscillospiraceae bacterium]